MNMDKRKAELAKLDKAALIDVIVNTELNDLVSGYADVKGEKGEEDVHGHGKRVPYIGWYWRTVDFANGDITIGDCGSFVGFMENNKWGYPERSLTPEEAAQVTKIVCDAHQLDHTDGNLAEIVSTTQAKLAELWPLLQTFPVNLDGYWIVGLQGNVGFADTEEDADKMVALLSESAPPGFMYRKVPALARVAAARA